MWLEKIWDGKGFANFILSNLIDIAQEIGCKVIHLEVNQNNKSAIKLYEKFNFKQVGLRKNYYNGTEDAILMDLYISI